MHDVAWAYPREPFVLPEPDRAGDVAPNFSPSVPPQPQVTTTLLPPQLHEMPPPPPPQELEPPLLPPLPMYSVARQLENYREVPRDGDE